MKLLKQVAAVAIVMALAATGASAATTIGMTAVTATSLGQSVRVDGTLQLGYQPTTFTDATGDARTPGTDIASATVTQADHRNVDFQIKLASPLPTVGSIPGVVHWFWTFNINGQAQQLHAMNSNYQALDPGSWYFQAQTCAVNPQTNVNECGGEEIPGEYTADGRIVWHLTNSAIGASKDATITDGVLRATHGAAGLVWLNGSAVESDTLNHGPVNLLQPSVTVSTRDAAGQVTSSTAATITSAAKFSATVAPSASYLIEARLGSATATSTIG